LIDQAPKNGARTNDKEPPMRKFLLASAAVTALVAVPAVANAQSAPKSQDMPAASSQQHAPKGSARDDMDSKRGPSAQSGERRETTGSKSSPMTDRAPKSGPSNEGRSAGSSQPEEKGMGASRSQGAQNDDKGNAGQKSGRSDQNRQTTGASEGSQDRDNKKAQKSGTSDMNKGTSNASQAGQDKQLNEQKPGQPKASSSSKSNERATTGQSPADQQTKGDRANRDNATGTSDGMKDRNTNQRDQAGSQNNQAGSQRDQGGRSSTSSSTSTSGSAAAKPEVQSKFTEVIEKQRVKPVTNVNFSVSVGSTVPRSVHFYDVPRDIVTIYPEYRGKKFIVVRDEIVIIEPGTKKVVAVMPRSARTTTGASTSGTSTSMRQSTSSKLQLAPEKRRVIRETVIKEQAAPRCVDLQVSVGAEVPRSLQLRHLPDVVVTEVPEIRSYDFCLNGDDVVLIDPSDYRIVEVID
jgi:hypothetical protein